MRLEPAEPNLSDLVRLDEVAEDVIAGRIAVAEASMRLRELDRASDQQQRAWTVVAFGWRRRLSRDSCAPVLDIAVAGMLGGCGLQRTLCRAEPSHRRSSARIKWPILQDLVTWIPRSHTGICADPGAQARDRERVACLSDAW
jgi:hypothetical protein